MLIWISVIIVFGMVFYISKKIADMMQVPIVEVFRRRKLETDIRTGDVSIDRVSSQDLVLLQKALYSVVGVGGFGPYYIPSFDIFSITQSELERRRTK